MNTMNVTKKPGEVVTPSPKKFKWTEVPIKNKEGVVVKRPSEEEPLVSEEVLVEAQEEEVEEVAIPDEVVEDGVVMVDVKESKDGI